MKFRESLMQRFPTLLILNSCTQNETGDGVFVFQTEKVNPFVYKFEKTSGSRMDKALASALSNLETAIRYCGDNGIQMNFSSDEIRMEVSSSKMESLNMIPRYSDGKDVPLGDFAKYLNSKTSELVQKVRNIIEDGNDMRDAQLEQKKSSNNVAGFFGKIGSKTREIFNKGTGKARTDGFLGMTDSLPNEIAQTTGAFLVAARVAAEHDERVPTIPNWMAQFMSKEDHKALDRYLAPPAQTNPPNANPKLNRNTN
jgi:hypothetical protein